MDPIGIVGTAVGIVSLGIQLSMILQKHFGDVADADGKFSGFVVEFQLTTQALSSVKELLDDDEAEKNAVDRVFSVEGRHNIDLTLAQCNRIFRNLATLIAKSGESVLAKIDAFQEQVMRGVKVPTDPNAPTLLDIQLSKKEQLLWPWKLRKIEQCFIDLQRWQSTLKTFIEVALLWGVKRNKRNRSGDDERNDADGNETATLINNIYYNNLNRSLSEKKLEDFKTRSLIAENRSSALASSDTSFDLIQSWPYKPGSRKLIKLREILDMGIILTSWSHGWKQLNKTWVPDWTENRLNERALYDTAINSRLSKKGCNVVETFTRLPFAYRQIVVELEGYLNHSTRGGEMRVIYLEYRKTLWSKLTGQKSPLPYPLRPREETDLFLIVAIVPRTDNIPKQWNQGPGPAPPPPSYPYHRPRPGRQFHYDNISNDGSNDFSDYDDDNDNDVFWDRENHEYRPRRYWEREEFESPHTRPNFYPRGIPRSRNRSSYPHRKPPKPQPYDHKPHGMSHYNHRFSRLEPTPTILDGPEPYHYGNHRLYDCDEGKNININKINNSLLHRSALSRHPYPTPFDQLDHSNSLPPSAERKEEVAEDLLRRWTTAYDITDFDAMRERTRFLREEDKNERRALGRERAAQQERTRRELERLRNELEQRQNEERNEWQREAGARVVTGEREVRRISRRRPAGGFGPLRHIFSQQQGSVDHRGRDNDRDRDRNGNGNENENENMIGSENEDRYENTSLVANDGNGYDGNVRGEHEATLDGPEPALPRRESRSSSRTLGGEPHRSDSSRTAIGTENRLEELRRRRIRRNIEWSDESGAVDVDPRMAPYAEFLARQDDDESAVGDVV